MRLSILTTLALTLLVSTAFAGKVETYDAGKLKPTDSTLKVGVGDTAPDFELPAVQGGTVRLSDYRGKKSVVLSFVPAAWTPVCSDQWPGYNIAQEMFTVHDAVIIGISVDNIPSQRMVRGNEHHHLPGALGFLATWRGRRLLRRPPHRRHGGTRPFHHR